MQYIVQYNRGGNFCFAYLTPSKRVRADGLMSYDRTRFRTYGGKETSTGSFFKKADFLNMTSATTFCLELRR